MHAEIEETGGILGVIYRPRSHVDALAYRVVRNFLVIQQDARIEIYERTGVLRCSHNRFFRS